LLLAAPILLFLIRSSPAFARPSEIGGMPVRARNGMMIVIRTRFFWLAPPLLIYMPFSSTALIFHIQAIAGMKGWSHELVALGFAAFAVAHASALLLLGGLIDRFSVKALLSWMNMPMFLGLVSLGLSDAPSALPLFMALMGMSSGLSQTAGAAVWAEVYGVERLIAGHHLQRTHRLWCRLCHLGRHGNSAPRAVGSFRMVSRQGTPKRALLVKESDPASTPR
jgi:MFS family permease